MRIRLEDEAATEAFGETLGRQLSAGDIVALYGALGAGKTTLARGVLRGLGYDGDVASPTFPIVVTYEPPQLRLPVWHVDLYRIERAEELGELGIDEALGEGALLVEWPERLVALWPETLRINLRDDGEGRCADIEAPASWRERLEAIAAGR